MDTVSICEERRESMTEIKKGNRVTIMGLDEILGAKEKGNIEELDIRELHEFRNHPFRVLDNTEMEALAVSIKQNGVLNPILVRKRKGGGFEIVSGHRRTRASELAGLKTIPARIMELSDEDAISYMVDSNIQRESVLPSEKAKAYRMKYDVLKHSGTKKGGMTLKKMAETEGDGWKTIQRYIALTNLSKDLLDMVDSGRLGIMQGVTLSYLPKTEQELVFLKIRSTKYRITKEKAKEIHCLSQNGQLKDETLSKVLSDNKLRKHGIKMEKIRRYFPKNMSDSDIELALFQILEAWNKEH